MEKLDKSELRKKRLEQALDDTSEKALIESKEKEKTNRLKAIAAFMELLSMKKATMQDIKNILANPEFTLYSFQDKKLLGMFLHMILAPDLRGIPNTDKVFTSPLLVNRSCKRCHGTGFEGIVNKVKNKEGKVTHQDRLVCSKCVMKNIHKIIGTNRNNPFASRMLMPSAKRIKRTGPKKQKVKLTRPANKKNAKNNLQKTGD